MRAAAGGAVVVDKGPAAVVACQALGRAACRASLALPGTGTCCARTGAPGGRPKSAGWPLWQRDCLAASNLHSSLLHWARHNGTFLNMKPVDYVPRNERRQKVVQAAVEAAKAATSGVHPPRPSTLENSVSVGA